MVASILRGHEHGYRHQPIIIVAISTIIITPVGNIKDAELELRSC